MKSWIIKHRLKLIILLPLLIGLALQVWSTLILSKPLWIIAWSFISLGLIIAYIKAIIRNKKGTDE